MTRRFLVPLLVAAALGACSPAYVYKAWRGHAALLGRQRPIAALVADPATPEPVRAKLRLVQEVRAFAFERMGIPPTKSFSGYAPVDGPAVTWVVNGSRRTSFQAKLWWFPIVGRVPYKGYFDREDARGEAARLEKGGWDAHVGGVTAYTTLRWFKDPVLSTMTDQPPGDVAELLLHELTHTAVFFKGQVDFNESLATYFGQAGAAEFLARRFGEGSPELAEYRRGAAREAERARLMDALHDELQAVYASTAAEAAKLGLRENVFAAWRERLEAKALNNAVVLASRRYHYDLGDFAKARERLGGDWPKTLALLESLDRKDPRGALKRWLASP